MSTFRICQRLPRLILHLPKSRFAYRPSFASYTRRAVESERENDVYGRDGPGSRFPKATSREDIERSGRDRMPQDHEIKDAKIMVIDNGVRDGPVATSFVLSQLASDESLRMIQPCEKPGELALCKVVNKREEYAKQRKLHEQRQQQKLASPQRRNKELELTWGIEKHDLENKMRLLVGFIARGARIELVFGRKKGGRKVPPDEAADLLQKIREDVFAQGGKETKEASGRVGGTLRMYVEGKSPR